MIITLVPKYLNKEGSTFQFISPLKECSTCNLRNVCYNLNVNSYYKVTKVRGKEHNCFIHEGNKVYTVEVQEEKKPIMIQRRMAKEGAIITYKHTKCDYYECPFADECILNLVKDESKVKVLSIRGNKCPKGYDLVEADIE